MTTAVLETPAPSAAPALLGRVVRWCWRAVRQAADLTFGLLALVVGLSVLVTVPVLQFAALGHLLRLAASFAARDHAWTWLQGLRRAASWGRWLALAAMQVGVLLGLHGLAHDAALVGGRPGAVAGAQALAVGATLLVAFVWVVSLLRGGSAWALVRPIDDLRWCARALAAPPTAGWRDRWRSLRRSDFLAAWWLGVRVALGSLAWLVLPTALLVAGRRQPLVGLVGALLLAVVLCHLPFLQVHAAVTGRWRALFAWRQARRAYARAPLAWTAALYATVVLALPLYLLKIEFVPRELLWLPALVFVAFMLPAHLLAGWAWGRALRRQPPAPWTLRWLGRLLLPIPAVMYVATVFLNQYTGWRGTAAAFEQHAFLLPVPF